MTELGAYNSRIGVRPPRPCLSRMAMIRDSGRHMWVKFLTRYFTFKQSISRLA